MELLLDLSLASCLSSDGKLFRAQFFPFLSWSLGTPEYSYLHNGHETDIKKITHDIFLGEDVKTIYFILSYYVFLTSL